MSLPFQEFAGEDSDLHSNMARLLQVLKATTMILSLEILTDVPGPALVFYKN